jgi:hypothetical protein
MPAVGFERTISEGERPQTYALDRAATGTGKSRYEHSVKMWRSWVPTMWTESELDTFVNIGMEFPNILINSRCSEERSRKFGCLLVLDLPAAYRRQKLR